MKKIIDIVRQKNADSQPYHEEFIYETDDMNARVSTALKEITKRGQAASRGDEASVRPLAWEHGCLQKKCGACAMVINNRPSLACDVRLADCAGDMIHIEPLKKFPVIEDLIVDRSMITESLLKYHVYPNSQRRDDGQEQICKDDDTICEASGCIRCGLCLEVCPNYYVGGKFTGMSDMTAYARAIAIERKPGAHIRDYNRHIYSGCGKSLACRDICPAGLDIEKLLSACRADTFSLPFWQNRQHPVTNRAPRRKNPAPPPSPICLSHRRVPKCSGTPSSPPRLPRPPPVPEAASVWRNPNPSR